MGAASTLEVKMNDYIFQRQKFFSWGSAVQLVAVRVEKKKDSCSS